MWPVTLKAAIWQDSTLIASIFRYWQRISSCRCRYRYDEAQVCRCTGDFPQDGATYPSAAYKFYCEKSLEDAHTAEADTRATYEVLKAQLDRYPDLQNDIAFLAEYSSFTKNVDFAGRMVYDDNGVEVFNFGKYKGMSVAEVLKKDPGYYSWILNSDFTLNTKAVLTKIRLREMSNLITK